MEEDVSVATGAVEKTELLDLIVYISENVLLWLLIILVTLRVIVFWLIENLIIYSSRLWLAISKGTLIRRMVQVCFWKTWSVISCAHNQGVAGILKLYQCVRRAIIGCFTIHHSISLQKDDLCEEVCKRGTSCITWARRHCSNRNVCHLYDRISRVLHHAYQVLLVIFQSRCPGLYNVVAKLGKAVLDSDVVFYLRYAISNIVRGLAACLRQIWVLIVRICLMIAENLLTQLCKMWAFSKRSCQTHMCHETAEDDRPTWTRICQDIRNLGDRLGLFAFMSRWRMSFFRCSPRSGFCTILVFVAFTFVLTTYLYSGGSVGVAEHAKSVRLQELEESQILRHHGPERHRDKSAIPWKRHKNQHMRQEEAGQEEKQHLSTPKKKQVQDVINLLSRMWSPNETSTLGIQKENLRRQIKFLREAMVSEETMLPKPAQPPACVGDIRPGEVEDILCIPRPKFLSHIKNPCWYSETPSSLGEKSLNCLPYFHILGCAKSGTTDLWNRLMSHPHTVSNDGLLHKEALWWSWYRYGMSGYSTRRQVQNFSDYVSLFQDTARQIQASIDKETLFHQILITGDASPPDFWDFRGWTNISQNRQHNIPQVITPHLMRHIYANPKFIIMFREPIDRLYSDYFFVGLGLTAQDFHNDILAAVDILGRCVKEHGLQHCFHDHELYVKLPVRLPFACYSVFMREWLQVFPLENFLFVKTEEYEKNPEYILKSVMEFLGLGPLKDVQLQVIAEEERSRITVQRQIAGPMLNDTRILLEELLGPCNTELARLIRSDMFTWST